MTQSTPSAVLEPVAAPDPDIIIRYLLAKIHRLRCTLKQLSGNPARRRAPKRSILGRLFVFPERDVPVVPISGSSVGSNPVQSDGHQPSILSARVSSPQAPCAKKPAGKKSPKPGEPYQLTLFDMDTI